MLSLGQVVAWLSDPLVKDWVAPVVLTVATILITRYMQPKARVIWSQLHAFSFVVPRTPRPGDPDQSINLIVHTRTVLVQNTGKAEALGVEIYFVFKPENLKLWPAVTYSDRLTPDNFYVVTIDRLVPKELITVELLQAGQDIPDIMRVRAGTHVATNKAMIWQPIYSRPYVAVIASLLLLGCFTVARALFWLVTLL